jgi:ectoine hydroxylase-related dioxygenase (phytanoyl-CoA dioxygenase family)
MLTVSRFAHGSPVVLDAAQCETFARDGVVRVPAAFDSTRMEDAVWSYLTRRGVVRDDPATWPQGLVSHLRSLRDAAVFASIGEQTTCTAVDQLLGKDCWKRPANWGQLLVTFPRGHHHMIWHLDVPYSEPLDPLRGVLVWSFLNSVAAGAGGTFVLAGSHRLMARFTAGRPAAGVEPAKVTRRAFYKSHPWLDALSTCETPTEEFGGEVDVDGLPARVLELTGEPGDVVLTHPLVLHTPAPNRGEAPRMMRIARLSRSA